MEILKKIFQKNDFLLYFWWLFKKSHFRLDQKWSRVDQIWSNLEFKVGPLLVQGGPHLVQGGPLLVQPRVSFIDTSRDYFGWKSGVEISNPQYDFTCQCLLFWNWGWNKSHFSKILYIQFYIEIGWIAIQIEVEVII